MAAVCDRIVFDSNFVCFGNESDHGGGEYTLSPRARAAAVQALEFLQKHGGTIRFHEKGYWMEGPFGSQYISTPIHLAETLGFK